MVTIKIETANGVYEIRKPAGRLGAKHMALLTKTTTAAPSGLQPGEPIPPEVIESMSGELAEVFEHWATELLPNLIVSGPFIYEEMPGEDQYAIFLAMVDQMKVSSQIFRVIE